MRSFIMLALALDLAAGAHRAGAQESPTISPAMAWKLRVAAFKSLQAGTTIRVSARDVGLRTGAVVSVGDSALTLDGPGRIPYAGIDSVWVRRNHATGGLLVGSLIGTIVSIAVVSGKHCGDQNCITTASLEGVGILLGGGLVGTIAGSAMPDWTRRYP